MSESINSEFEAYVKAELGDIAVVSEGRYISPKIQNYYKVWQHREAQLADWKALHAAIATGQPIWPNNWSQEVAMLAYEFDVKNTQIDAAKNDVELGAAIMRACRDLPMNFTLEVNLERGNGNVILFDTGFTDITPNLGDMTFAKKVNGCIDAAIQAGEIGL